MKEETKQAKPIILIQKELSESIIKTINDSGLPAFIVEPIIKDLLMIIQNAAQNEYKAAHEEYQRSIEK